MPRMPMCFVFVLGMASASGALSAQSATLPSCDLQLSDPPDQAHP